ncbi:MAG: hypothetical protein AAGU14_06125 [Eubacteriaceae bacterium]
MMIYECKNSVLASFISASKQTDLAKVNQEFIDDMLILICNYLQNMKQKEEEYENLEYLRRRLNKHIVKYQNVGFDNNDIVDYLRLYI